MNGDIVAISEKALSSSRGNLIDESAVKPSLFAKFLARFWMRYIWGYLLGPLCRLDPENIKNLRNYPVKEGARHKQVALERTGFLRALKPFSEGGIDASNVPYSYTCLPLSNPEEIAQSIRSKIKEYLGKDVCVMIVDTDKTYSIRNLHLAPRSTSVKGIHSVGCFFSYIIGRMLKLRKRATPLVVVGFNPNPDEALNLARLADRAFHYGAGRTVWDMAKKFDVDLTDVTWEMLESVEHRPIAIIRRSGN